MAARSVVVLFAPWTVAGELAESLWQDGSGPEESRWWCPGAYADPPMPHDREVDSSLFPITVSADLITSHDGVRADATGSVAVRQGNRLLTARSAVVDRSTSLSRATGDARFREPGLFMHGTSALVDMATGAASMDDAEFVLTSLDLRGRAEEIQRRGATVELVAASMTGCPPGADVWRIRAATVRLDADKQVATTRHARLILGGVPVFYTPYLRFPVSDARTSGFLFPGIGYDADDGIDVSVPYYFNLAPNYDATLTPRWIGRRGAGVEAEFRHRSVWSDTLFDSAFLADDRDYDGRFSRSDALDTTHFEPADRWLFHVDHRGRLGGLQTRVDFTTVSDNDYFGDFGGIWSAPSGGSRVSLERRGEIQYSRGGLVARLLAQGFQRLEPGRLPHRRVPEAGITYVGKLRGPLAFSVGASWTSFDSPDGAASVVTGKRYHLEPRLRFGLIRPWGFVNVTGGARRTGYDLDNVRIGADPRPRRDIRLGILDTGLFFERGLEAFGPGWTQTLEPRLYYLRQSYQDQDELPTFDASALTFSFRQLFRDNRFAGLDRIGDANRVSVGVASRLLDARGAEVLSARLGAMTHLSRRRVDLTEGPTERPDTDLIGEVTGSRGPLRLGSKLAWDVSGRELDELGIGIAYRRDARRIVNIGYRRRFPDVDQTDVSFRWPLTALAPRWSAFGRWNYDWRFGQMIDGFAGFEYANCCLEVKLLWHRTLRSPRNVPIAEATADRGVMLQIALKGLAGFGSKVDSRLVRGIKGYSASRRDANDGPPGARDGWPRTRHEDKTVEEQP